jgi:hypothetical protein
MIDNAMRNYVNNIIDQKGFHDTKFTQLQSLTYRQLCHMLSELAETSTVFENQAGDLIAEEIADIAIVFLDLMGLHDYPVPRILTVPPQISFRANVNGLAMAIGRTADAYRKTNKFDPYVIWRGVHMLASAAGVDLEVEVQKKMSKNEQRPRLYGVAT